MEIVPSPHLLRYGAKLCLLADATTIESRVMISNVTLSRWIQTRFPQRPSLNTSQTLLRSLSPVRTSRSWTMSRRALQRYWVDEIARNRKAGNENGSTPGMPSK